MYKFILTALLSLSAANVALAGVGVHCGATEDATFSDCQALVDPGTWNGAWAGTGNVFHYTNILKNQWVYPAYNVACHGNCCVYTAGPQGWSPNRDLTREEAAGLFGCADRGSNKINVLRMFDDGHGVCISNGNGCGDCFDGKSSSMMWRT